MEIRMPDDLEVRELVRMNNSGLPLTYAVVWPILKSVLVRGQVTQLTFGWGYRLANGVKEDALLEGAQEDLQQDYGEIGFQMQGLCRIVWVGFECPRCEYRSKYEEDVSEHILGAH